MSQQGPIIVVSTAERPSFAAALDDAKMFPVIDTTWADAARAVEQLQPAAVLVAMSETVEPGFERAGEADRRAAALSAADRDRSRSARCPKTPFRFRKPAAISIA